jgi:hypothetical protein
LGSLRLGLEIYTGTARLSTAFLGWKDRRTTLMIAIDNHDTTIGTNRMNGLENI